jgi:hypothetical protein
MTRDKILHGLIFLVSVFASLSLASCNMPLGELFVAASPTPLPTPTQIVLPTPSTGSIAGWIWHDVCAVPGEGQPLPDQPPEGCVEVEGGGYRANGIRDMGEPGLEGVEISLGTGACPSTGLANTTTDSEGNFSFAELAAGIYCLIVDPSHPRNSQILIPGEWTAGPADASGLISTSIDLGEGESFESLAFGWDFQFLPPYEPPPTEIVPPTETPESSETPTPTEEGTSTPTPEGTPVAEDPNIPSGNPDWRDTFDSGGNWPLYEDDHVRFEVKEGKAVMTAFNPDFYEGWMLSWPELTNFYLEGTFNSGNCSGRDRYGLVVRSTASGEQYVGYLFGVTCDGRYSLRTWDGEEFGDVISWTSSALIKAGSDKTQRLGLWAKGNRLILYVDRKKLTEIQDTTYTNGKFGLFVGSVETDDLQIKVDEIAYWNLQ